jgi:GxxExxY protein
VPEVEKDIVVLYDGLEVGRHRLDILVEGRIIVELKTVEALSRAHYAQVRSYLGATGHPVALLVNVASDRADQHRPGRTRGAAPRIRPEGRKRT